MKTEPFIPWLRPKPATEGTETLTFLQTRVLLQSNIGQFFTLHIYEGSKGQVCAINYKSLMTGSISRFAHHFYKRVSEDRVMAI
jgi:hypothetical protein